MIFVWVLLAGWEIVVGAGVLACFFLAGKADRRLDEIAEMELTYYEKELLVNDIDSFIAFIGKQGWCYECISNSILIRNNGRCYELKAEDKWVRIPRGVYPLVHAYYFQRGEAD